MFSPSLLSYFYSGAKIEPARSGNESSRQTGKPPHHGAKSEKNLGRLDVEVSDERTFGVWCLRADLLGGSEVGHLIILLALAIYLCLKHEVNKFTPMKTLHMSLVMLRSVVQSAEEYKAEW